MDQVLVVDAPIHSAFITPNTPGSGIPSHGTAKYGEMHAIDLVGVDPSNPSMKPYRPSLCRYIVAGLRLEDFHGWGEKVYAPVEGKVVKAVDGIEERDPVSIFRDLGNVITATKGFEREELDFSAITGNCVIIQYGSDGYCLLAHLRQGSVRVKVGQTIQRNEAVGELGHSGNSTMPHLHMQFMDSLDFRHANGIPFKIKEYSVYRRGAWIKKLNDLPTKKEICKYD